MMNESRITNRRLTKTQIEAMRLMRDDPEGRIRYRGSALWGPSVTKVTTLTIRALLRRGWIVSTKDPVGGRQAYPPCTLTDAGRAALATVDPDLARSASARA
jgi:hypothetical protein